MKKILSFNLKKVLSLIALSITMVIGFVFASCSNRSFAASFKKDEYVVSIGETIDISEDIELQNITLQDLSFYSSDTNLLRIENADSLAEKNKTIFTALDSGNVTLYIYYRGEVLDTSKVTIKNKFMTPTNIQVANDGTISWDEVSFKDSEGNQITATYSIMVSSDNVNFNTYDCDTNEYKLPRQGRYYVKVKAKASTYADESEYSEVAELYYNTVRVINSLMFTNQTDGKSESGVLSWNASSNADYYLVKLGEVESSEKIFTTNYTIDTSTLESGEVLSVSIKACSNSEELSDSPYRTITITKLGMEEPSVENGVITWDRVNGASSYVVSYSSVTDPENIKGTISTTELSTSLGGLASGRYNISVQAVSNNRNPIETYYVNSKAYDFGKVVKLDLPTFTYDLTDGKLNTTLSIEQEEIKNFEVRIYERGTRNQKVEKLTITQPAVSDVYSVSKSIDLASQGYYEIYLKTLTEDVGQVEIDGEVYDKVVVSDEELELTILNLPELENLTHRYDENENSIISFTRPSYEILYSCSLDFSTVSINGNEVEVQKTYSAGTQTYSLNLGKITTEYQDVLNPNNYEISILVDMLNLPSTSAKLGTDKITKTSTKNLTMLSISMMNLSKDELIENYTYSAPNTSYFEYSLFKTDSNYDTSEYTGDDVIRDSYGRVTKPSAGYYAIFVKAYTSLPNLYLNATAVDYFYVTQTLEEPTLDFGKTNVKLEDGTTDIDANLLSGYYVEITTVDGATHYEISLDGVFLSSVSDTDGDGKVYYYFTASEDFSSGDFEIRVVAKGDDDFIYHQSEKAIQVERLSSPAVESLDGQAITFNSSNDLHFYKNSVSTSNELTAQKTTENEMTNYVVNLENIYNNFSVLAYASKNDVVNEIYYLDSDVATFKIRKITTPTNLNFVSDSVEFVYNDTNALADAEHIEIVSIVTLQSSSTENKEYEYVLPASMISIDAQRKVTFVLEDLISALKTQYSDFESLYSQKESIKLEIFIRASYYNVTNEEYVLSSQKATSQNINVSYITIEKLPSPTIRFNENQKLLYWEGEEGFDYEILLNGEVVSQPESYNSSLERYELDLSPKFNNPSYEGQYLNYKVRKVAENYLSSNYSNEISLYFLKKVVSINVYTDEDNNSFASFTYNDNNIDKSKISVNINSGNAITVISDVTKTTYQFALSGSVLGYAINIVGYNEFDAISNKTTYYISSQSGTFGLEPFETAVSIEDITIEDSKISWTNYGNQFNYIVYFDKANGRFAKIRVTENELSLSNEILEELPTDTFTVSVLAVYKNFVVNANEERYYGGAKISEGTVYKLEGVANLRLNISESSETISDEIAVVPKLSWIWNEAHTAGADITFEVSLNDNIIANIDYIEGTSNYSYNIQNSQFAELGNVISVRVLSDKDVVSSEELVNIYKFRPAIVSVSDDRILNISYQTINSEVVASRGYIVKVVVGGVTTEFVTTDSEIDLSNIIGENDGDYSVEVLIKNVSNTALRPISSGAFEGTILRKPTITQNENGFEITSSEDVKFILSIKQNGRYIVENVENNGSYTFADELQGVFTIEVYAMSEGLINSSVATKTISLNRLSGVENVTLTRTRTYNYGETTSYKFTWNAVSGATKYVCTIYNQNSTTLIKEETTNAFITLNEEALEMLGGSGSYYLGIRALGDINNGDSDSIEVKASMSIANQVEQISLTNDGLLKLTGRGDILTYIYDGSRETTVILRQSDASYANGKYSYTYLIETLSGQIHIQAISLANENDVQADVTNFAFDSLPIEGSFDKLKSIQNATLNLEDGKIYITLTEALSSGTKFNFECDSNVYTFTPASYENSSYSFDFIDIFNELDVTSSGEKDFTIYLTKEGSLRSEAYASKFDFAQKETTDYTENRGIDLLHDYLLIHPKQDKNLKLILLTVKLNSQVQKYTLNASDYFGYWHTTEDGEYFSTTIDDSATSSEEVYAIQMNNVLNRVGNYRVSIAYIYENGSHMFGINGWSEELAYEKLPSVFNVFASEEAISWALSASSNYSSVTGYYVVFEDENGDCQYIYVPSYSTRKVAPEDIAYANKTFKVYVIAVSTIGANKIASNKTYFKHTNGNNFKVIKANEPTNVIAINDGVLSIDLSRTDDDKAYGKLYGESLPIGTQLSTNVEEVYYMPYGRGRVSADDFVNAGTGTFTAIIYKNQEMYIRTEFISTSNVLIEEAKIYAQYNISIDDILDGWNTKFSTQQACVEALANTVFTYPFVYNLESLTSGLNTFALTFKNADTMSETKLMVNGLEIVQKTEYVSTITTLLNGISDSVAGKAVVSSFLQSMKAEDSFTGLATSNLLFDEIGSTGESFTGEVIEAGNYEIYLMQIGFEVPNTAIGNETFVLSSPRAKVVDSCRVTASPVVKTYRVINADGYSYSYFLKFAPTVLNNEMLQDYVIVLSYVDGENTKFKTFEIKYEESEWKFYKTATANFALTTVNEGGIDYVLIPLNNSNGINQLLDISYSYTANIYSVGNSSRLNSKTEPISISFLGFNSAIRLTSKGFEWTSYANGDMIYPTTVIYKRSSEANARTSIIAASTSVSRFNPEFDGLYNYIMFISQGNIGRYEIVVDSDIYRVENVFKLYGPSVGVNWEGNFTITNSVNNPALYALPTYKITNDVSEALHTRLPDEDELFVTTTSSTYKAGRLIGTESAYKETEMTASKYLFASVGDEIESFASRIYNDGEYYLLDYGAEQLFITSEKTSIFASILENPSSVFINTNGDIEWTGVTNSNTGEYEASFNDGRTVIVYKVVVEFYHETSTGLTKDEKIDTYYTKTNILPASYIEGDDETIDYTYKVTIYAFPALDDQSLLEISTTFNSDLRINNVLYSDETHYILSNAGSQHSFTRLNDVENITFNDGILTWESEYTDLNRYKFTVIYNGPTASGELLGQYSYDSNLGLFKFVLDDENQILSSSLEYTISVYVSAKDTSLNMLTSFESTSGNVRILPAITDEYISKTETVVDNVNCEIFDIKPFFLYYKNDELIRYSKVNVKFKTYNISSGRMISANSNDFDLYYNSDSSYESAFTVMNTSGTYDKSENPYVLYLASGYRIEIEIQVVVNYEGSGNYINSYKYCLQLSEYGWTSLDEITYDDALQRFVWTYGKASDGSEYEGDAYFKVSIKYEKSVEQPNRSIKKTTYTRIYDNINQKFFVPEMTECDIVEFKVQGRIGKNNVNSEWKTYSTKQNFTLFTSGQGTSADPYVISSQQEFKNMNILGDKPNYLAEKYTLIVSELTVDANGGIIIPEKTEDPVEVSGLDEVYCYKLANDITLTSSGNYIITSPYGSNFDGDGNTITFTASSGISPETQVTGRVAQGEETFAALTFNQVGSIFSSVAENGKIENLKLNVSYTYLPIGGGVNTQTLFAGLVLTNYGSVEKVELTGFNVTISSEIANTLMLSGLVGVNYNNVSECKFSTQTKINNAFSAAQTLYFAGMVGFNEGVDAKITLCELNSGSLINVGLTQSQNGVIQVAGVVLSNVNGTISLCGNRAIVTANCPNGTAYSSAIVVYSNGGSIVDSFNIANITGTTNYAAGIVYACNSNLGNIFGFGSVNSISETSFIIAKKFSGSVLTTCYASKNYDQVVPATRLVSNLTVTTSNANYNIRVVYASGSYSISFV